MLVSRHSGVDLPIVEAAVARAGRVGASVEEPPEAAVSRPLSGDEKAERELLRLVLANDASLRAIGVDGDWLNDPAHRAAFDRIWPAIEALAPGVPPDLGRLIGSAEGAEDALLRRLAMAARPLEAAGSIVNRLKASAYARRIDTLRSELEAVDPEGDPQGYSDRFEELIALERQRRQLRSER